MINEVVGVSIRFLGQSRKHRLRVKPATLKEKHEKERQEKELEQKPKKVNKKG